MSARATRPFRSFAPSRRRRTLAPWMLVLTWSCIPLAVHGQEPGSTESIYRVPAPELVALVDQPTTPAVSVSPGNDRLLLMEIPGLLTIADLSEPELRLAGLRINPRTNGPSRSSYFTALTFRSLDGNETIVTGLPSEPKLGNVSWSPDGSFVAFSHTARGGLELWVADAGSGVARRLVGARLNDAVGTPFRWHASGEALMVRLVSDDRGPAPEAGTVPEGPILQESTGRRAAARTYQDLLEDSHAEALFEHYLTTQVARVDLDGGLTPIGSPGLITRADPAPGGNHLLVDFIHRPFSYLVPYSRFPTRTEVWDLRGGEPVVIADLPLAEEVPIGRGATRTGRRSIGWRADAPETVFWVEARDGGDPRAEAEVRDRLFLLDSPFTGEPRFVADLGLRFAGVQWGDGDLALVRSIWWSDRTLRTWRMRPDAADPEPSLLSERSLEDRYGDPGFPLTRTNAAGRSVLAIGPARDLYLVGGGASPEGNRPFLDRWSPETGATERLWRSEAPYYERPVQILAEDGSRLITQREAVTEPPNYFIRNLDSNRITRLTDFEHPTPELAEVEKELIRYERADGVMLTARLYLPPGYKSGDGPLPTLMWAYPREFKSAELAGQLTDSPYRFVRVSYWAALPMLTQGWAVLDNPSMPIIGEGESEPNDQYVEQLVASAEAAVDEVVRRGVTDRDRVAIGGHSYGAFMTANLLAHSDLFRAGIARSGAYNRTLTPFGFQAEERTFWEAPDVYFAMSPLHACRAGGRADPDDPRAGGQQLGHVPDPERAVLQRRQGARRHREARDVPARKPWLPGSRVASAHVVGAADVAEEARGGRSASRHRERVATRRQLAAEDGLGRANLPVG